MAIVYQHRKPGHTEPFYIGIGKTKKRAYSKSDRNKHWQNVVNKYGYEVDITHTDIIWEEACAIERYLIDFWGREDLELGPLVNMTDGGEGTINPSEEVRKIIRIANSGKNNGMYGRIAENNPMYGKGYLVSGENSGMYGKGYLITGKNNGMHGKGYLVSGENSPVAKTIVIKYASEEIKIFATVKQAADYLEISTQNLSSMLTGNRKIYKRILDKGIISIQYK